MRGFAAEVGLRAVRRKGKGEEAMKGEGGEGNCGQFEADLKRREGRLGGGSVVDGRGAAVEGAGVGEAGVVGGVHGGGDVCGG